MLLSAVSRQLTAVSFFVLLSACSTPPEKELRTKIRVVTQPYLALAPIHIAAAESLFAKHGLDVEMVPMNRPTDAVPLLLTGEVDVLSSTPQAGFFNAAARGEPIRAVAERGYYNPAGCAHLALVVRVGIDTARAARSVRRLSYDRQAPMIYVTEKMLQRGGLTIEKLEGTTEVPHIAEIDALKSGKLDVALAGEPWLSRVQDAGAANVWIRAEDAAPNETFGYVFFGSNLLRRDREAGRRFMSAYREAVALYHQGKTQRNIDILASATGEAHQLVEKACWASMRADSRIDTGSLMAFQKWAHDKGLVPTLATIAQLWDSTFIAHADSQAKSATH